MKHLFKIIAAAGVVAASVSVSKAQPYAIAGDFNGWDNTFLLGGGPSIYTNVMTGGTAGNYESFKVIAVPGSWATTYPGNNCQIKYDTTGGNTVYFYPGSVSDGWAPLANRVGYEDPGNMAWELTGDFTTPQWGGIPGTQSDPLAQMTLKAGSSGVYTNIYIVATPGTYNFKFRTPGTWNEVQFGSDFGNGGGNAVFTTSTANQAVLFQLDLPNGRWQAGGPPAFCNVQFSVDMTVVAASDPLFDPNSVTVNGDALAPNGWGGTACTNNPTAANTNIFTSPPFTIQVGTSVQFQYRYLSGGNTVYDALGGVSGVNRTYVVPNLPSTNLPPVYFNDALPLDLLNMDTLVSFNVNMTNAVGTDAHVFDPNADIVYINGDFVGWLAWNPITLYGAGLNCTNNPVGSEVYTYTMLFPKGHTRSLTYKYAINAADNEAGFAQNHFRYIRSTNGVENLPLDTFGTQYNEPKFGNLAIGKAVGGYFPVTWLGYPGVHLQNRTDLSSGSWVDQMATDSQSSMNWPAGSGSQFFRLVKP